MKKLIFTIILLSVCSIHAQTGDKETLTQLNQMTVSSYRNQKIDEALKFAQQAVELSIKIYGTEHQETATAYTNLGVIYRDKKKFKESVENLQTAADIYQTLPGLKGKELVDAFEILAFSQFLDGNKKDAEANYLKALETAENKFGKESKESFSPTLNMASFYARDKKFDKADEFYLKSYSVAIKNFDRNAKEFEQIEDSRSCLLITQKFNTKNNKAFHEAKDKLFGETVKQNTGIVNGKALSLPKPAYPAEARPQRIGGTVSVRVKIDEQGNVIEARAICGPPILAKASVEAAKGAKFSPTLIDGNPTKISGVVVYNFVP